MDGDKGEHGHGTNDCQNFFKENEEEVRMRKKMIRFRAELLAVGFIVQVLRTFSIVSLQLINFARV